MAYDTLMDYGNDRLGVSDIDDFGLVSLPNRNRRKKGKKNKRNVKHSRRYVTKPHKRRNDKKAQRGVKFTKRGQPYVITKSGRAKFIKR